MRKAIHLTMALLLSLTVACSSKPDPTPQLTLDHSACGQCGMLVSDFSWAGAIQMADGSEHAFDDPVCLLTFVKSGAASNAKETWFHDYDDDRWVKASQSAFVVQQKLRGPMGGKVLAFANRNAANRAANKLEGEVVVSYAELLQRKDVRDDK